MSDLTRRVLDVQKAHENLCKRTGLPLPASMSDVETLATAAPILARQVEALEALADELDEAANIEVRTISGEVLDAEYSEGLRYAATRIRDALTEAAHD